MSRFDLEFAPCEIEAMTPAELAEARVYCDKLDREYRAHWEAMEQDRKAEAAQRADTQRKLTLRGSARLELVRELAHSGEWTELAWLVEEWTDDGVEVAEEYARGLFEAAGEEWPDFDPEPYFYHTPGWRSF